MNLFDSKNKIFITPIIGLLISFLLIVFLIWPVFMDIEAGSKEMLAQKGESSYIEIQNSKLESFKKNYESYKPNLERIDLSFVDSQDPVAFINFLEESASASNIEAEISLSQAFEKTSALSSLAISLNVSAEGGFLNVLRFAEELENGHYLIEINKLTIRRAAGLLAKNDKNSGDVRADFLINVLAK